MKDYILIDSAIMEHAASLTGEFDTLKEAREHVRTLNGSFHILGRIDTVTVKQETTVKVHITSNPRTTRTRKAVAGK